MPCYPALALLIGCVMAGENSTFVRYGKWIVAAIAAMACAAIAIILGKVWFLPTPGDISNALTQHPENYTLSLGHMGDLTLHSFAYLRPPLMLAGLAHLPSLAWFPSPLRFIFWGLCALAAAGLLRPVWRELAGVEARLGPGHELARGAGGELGASDAHLSIARNVMLALNALFLGYNALDAVYLWGGRPPEGLSHPDYAHGGAAWLTVALVLSTIVLGALFRGAIVDDARGKVARVLGSVWAGQNIVLGKPIPATGIAWFLFKTFRTHATLVKQPEQPSRPVNP